MGRTVKPEQQKLFLLYAMKAVGIPLLDEQLIEMAGALALMNTFEVQSNLAELVSSQLAQRRESVVGRLYSVSTMGASTLELFQKELPFSKREAIDAYARQNKDRLRLESQLFAEYLQIGENQFRVTLKLMEKDVPAFELNLLTTSKAEAARIAEGWRRNALEVYQSVFRHLLKK